MTVKLLGSGDETPDTYYALNAFFCFKWTAEESGNVTEFKVKAFDTGNVKVAIYEDNAGEPGDLLNSVDTDQAMAVGWNTITFPSTAVVKDTPYWLAIISDANCPGRRNLTGVVRYRTVAYAGFTFPDPAGIGFSSTTTSYGVMAGWGEAIAPPVVGRSFGFIIG